MDLDDKLEAKWDQARGRLQEAWGALTDDDLDRSQGKRTRLIGILKERTGEATDDLERRVNRLIERL